jgi:two-component system, NtrC family, nitrogen regulation sensor histidine kinase NtrY
VAEPARIARRAVTFRLKLWIVFAATISLTVAAVTVAAYFSARAAFEELDSQRAQALVAQFRFELAARGRDIMDRVRRAAQAGAIRRVSIDLSKGQPDPAGYVEIAQELASAQALDFLELVAGDGTILSSAQWPARFGYKDEWMARQDLRREGAFLRRIDLPDGVAVGLLAAQPLQLGETSLWVSGGKRLDKEFLAALSLPEGMRALLYLNLDASFSAQNLTSTTGVVAEAAELAGFIGQARLQNSELTKTIVWPGRGAEIFHALPLLGEEQDLLAVLLLGSSQHELGRLTSVIRRIGLLAGVSGILLGLLASWAISRRMTRSVAQLADGARRVASGDWAARVQVSSHDEIGHLAQIFNRMTSQLAEQRDKLVQAERVAAWRELARRLAHELKNPLFPLQITVENMQRARTHHPEEFDEVFREGTATLTAELANLKTIIGRFSDFSKMPPPRKEPVQLNDAVRQVLRLFDAQLQAAGSVRTEVGLDETLDPVSADLEQLKRVLQNLVLNALDAMPDGGTLTLRTSRRGGAFCVEVSDTGTGLTPEERERLFTPYYTSKRHGTGLGLAIVQAVVSDHGGQISVESEPGKGSTFRIVLPASA